MSGCVGNLSAQQEETLNTFRSKFTDILPSEELNDDYFLLRWLRARNFDLQKSEQMLKQHCRFRKEWKIDKLVAEDDLPEFWRNYYPGNYIGYDKDGAPLFYVNVGKFDVKGLYLSLKSEELTKYTLAVPEKGMQLCAEQSKKVLGILEDNYPEFMKHVFVVNANYAQVLMEYVDKDVIPKAVGGNLVDENGDPNCIAMIGHGGEVPISYYRSELLKESAHPLEDFTSVVIARGDSLKLNYDIEDSGTLLKWEFKTEYRNIGFGVIKVIKSDDGSEENYEVIPVMRRNCQIVLEEGSYLCEDPGTYILHFDNSFSWIRSKNLHYIIEVVPADKTMPEKLDTDSPLDKATVNGNSDQN
ncbi:uncharacterized protein TRIADDRAFT_60318 [Trichoplax adhaerens]|uniref:SEC14-like protein 2 n=1 Tax=Trichoplax adhaerens TaxID=10228 RepID=B3S7W4_TRIAD|nr:hypothetical protein TRIADDRAFT_60318 [Trichoplax adhaerens]EDV21367.1 hypothetical protein TRIADDRAFT_60318 [Trichoplax adhaerens]|eukprot:XP_002116334.1 hypothetical protein TRIADDRAFT_60318 [Trichoplax adhaerens]